VGEAENIFSEGGGSCLRYHAYRKMAAVAKMVFVIFLDGTEHKFDVYGLVRLQLSSINKHF